MKTRVLAFSLITLATILGLVLIGPITQDEAYHDFADQRSFLGVPNFLNVVSNLPFLLIGITGLQFVLRKRSAAAGNFLDRFEAVPYISVFVAITLTCFGSAYYHLLPTSERLVWDRLPMSIAFMSLLAAVIVERIHLRAGLLSLAPLMVLGATSVLYWHAGEQSGRGDLRLYVFVQFYSLLAVILS